MTSSTPNAYLLTGCNHDWETLYPATLDVGPERKWCAKCGAITTEGPDDDQ